MADLIARFVAAFATGSALSGVATAATSVYWFKDFDPKFRDAPSVALEIELWGTLAFTLLGALVVGVTTYLLRSRVTRTRSSVLSCFAWGVAYPPLLRLLERTLETNLSTEALALPVVGWVYLILFPALCVLHARRQTAENSENAV